MALLAENEIAQRLAGSGWTREGDAIVREWTLADFAAALAFVNAWRWLAEAANHHPDILLHGWNKVRLELSTHSAGGLTDADFALAARSTGLLTRVGRYPNGSHACYGRWPSRRLMSSASTMGPTEALALRPRLADPRPPLAQPQLGGPKWPRS